MAAPTLHLKCPHCFVALTLRDRAFLSRRAVCPQCGEPMFLAPDPERGVVGVLPSRKTASTPLVHGVVELRAGGESSNPPQPAQPPQLAKPASAERKSTARSPMTPPARPVAPSPPLTAPRLTAPPPVSPANGAASVVPTSEPENPANPDAVAKASRRRRVRAATVVALAAVMLIGGVWAAWRSRSAGRSELASNPIHAGDTAARAERNAGDAEAASDGTSRGQGERPKPSDSKTAPVGSASNAGGEGHAIDPPPPDGAGEPARPKADLNGRAPSPKPPAGDEQNVDPADAVVEAPAVAEIPVGGPAGPGSKPPAGPTRDPIDVAERLKQPIARFEQIRPATARQMLDLLEEMTGVPVKLAERPGGAFDESLNRQVTLKLQATTLKEILQAVVDKAGLTWEIEDETILIRRRAEM